LLDAALRLLREPLFINLFRRTRPPRWRRRRAHSQPLARLLSAAPSGTRGGDLGWLYPGAVPPEMEQQLDKLSVGEISEPIRTPYGWHIFQVLDRRTKSGINERQREQAREALREQKLGDAVLDWERRLRSEAYVEKRINKPTE